MSIIGFHSSRSLFENPASNTAARVSLPLTMSNISRTNGLSPGYPPHPFWPVLAGPVCERAGYKTQSSFPSTAFFELFSATRRRPKNLRKEPTKVSSGPSRGPRATNCGRREEAIYAPPIRHASGFWSKITKPRVFHRTGSLASRTVDSGDCGHELIAEQAPASLYEGFLDNR